MEQGYEETIAQILEDYRKYVTHILKKEDSLWFRAKDLELAMYMMEHLIEDIVNHDTDIIFFVNDIGPGLFDVIQDMYHQHFFNYKNYDARCEFIEDYVDVYRGR